MITNSNPARAWEHARNILPAKEIFYDSFVPVLSQMADLFAESMMIERCRFKALKRRPASRHVAVYTLTLRNPVNGQRGRLELVAKKDTDHAIGKAVKEFRALQLLQEAGFAGDMRFEIPRPIYLSKDLKLMLQERARGAPLTAYLGGNDRCARTYMSSAGEWLARLHGLKPPAAGTCFYEDDILNVRLYVDAVSATRPCLRTRLGALEKAITHKLLSFQDIPATMIHGDYHPEHIFVTSGTVAVIDFERFCISDSAKDLGSFIAHMRTLPFYLGRSPSMVERQTNLFLHGYLGNSPLIQRAGLAERVAVFTAKAALEALYYVVAVLKNHEPERAEIYLRCAEQSGVLGVSESGLNNVAASIQTHNTPPIRKLHVLWRRQSEPLTGA